MSAEALPSQLFQFNPLLEAAYPGIYREVSGLNVIMVLGVLISKWLEGECNQTMV